MAQMQPIQEPRVHLEISIEEALGALKIYNLEVEAVEKALAAGEYDGAFSHLLVAANSASIILRWGSGTRGAWGAFAKGVKEKATDATRAILWYGMGGFGPPPPDSETIIALIENWLNSSWAAKLTEMAGRVAGGLGAESYALQAGFPAGVSIALVFPAGKSQPSVKKQPAPKRRKAK